MRTSILLFVALSACVNDRNLTYVKDYGGVYESSLTGRACDADSGRWLEGAVVYTHIVNDADELIDTRETYTGADGTWTLDELRGGQTYTVYVQYGNDIVDMFNIEVPDSTEVAVPTAACGADLGRVAVITGNYDDWEPVLTEVGVTNYQVINGLTGDELGQFLSGPENLAEFGALFFAGGHIEEDVLYDSDGSDTAGTVTAVRTAIRDFVSAGGFVYASDWSYDVVELCWPDRIDFLGDDESPDAAQLGEPGTVRASLLDHAMVEAVGGDTRDVSFDLDTWPLIESVEDTVTIYERASEVTYRDGTEQYTQSDVPLLVSFYPDGGKVVFSSWRTAANLDGRGPSVIRFVLGE
ncbi:MAG: hypothetical protein Q8P41_17070 [Pseudomonadota bacterium]|nr:hypothetical protein [Pseudomonadota bacterium]